ncbi:MAG: dTMP kinase, partial [Firmicutes bacterium]|nr:dTMP kinase [Bacillota bacterium]
MPPEIKGKFITFEGLEGAGKSTQAERLYHSLFNKGYPVVKTREPGGTDLGDAIRSVLADKIFSSMAPMTEALLFSAARYEHIDKLILPELQEGKIIICDRFADATVAYQCFGRGLDLELINQVNFIA